MAKVCEFVYRVVVGENIVMVWGTTKDLMETDTYGRQRRELEEIISHGRGHAWAVESCERIGQLDWVNAVEVSTPMGGVVVRKDG